MALKTLNRLRTTIVTGWFVVLVAAFATRMAIGGPLTVGEGAAWVLLGGVPATILLSVFRGAPPQTVGEVLYDVEHQDQARPDNVRKS